MTRGYNQKTTTEKKFSKKCDAGFLPLLFLKLEHCFFCSLLARKLIQQNEKKRGKQKKEEPSASVSGVKKKVIKALIYEQGSTPANQPANQFRAAASNKLLFICAR